MTSSRELFATFEESGFNGGLCISSAVLDELTPFSAMEPVPKESKKDYNPLNYKILFTCFNSFSDGSKPLQCIISVVILLLVFILYLYKKKNVRLLLYKLENYKKKVKKERGSLFED